MSVSELHSINLLPPKEHRARKLAMVLLILAPPAFGLFALWLGQDMNWDFRNYHWYNGYAFVTGRYGADLLPSQFPWFYNPSLDALFYIFATHVPAMATGFTLGAVQGLNFILLFMLAYAGLVIANPRHKVLVCAGLATLGMLGGGGIAMIGTTFYDNITSLGLFSSALLVISYHHRLMQDVWQKALMLAVISGVPAGLAMGFKLPCFTFCFGLCAAILFTGGPWQRRLMAAFGFGFGVLLGIALSYGHWGWYLQTHFDSLVFPYFNNLIKAPLAPQSFSSDTQYVPRNLHDFFLFPYIVAMSPFRAGEIPWSDWRIPILYSLLPVVVIVRLIFGRSRFKHDAVATPNVARYLLWAVALAYFAWLKMFGIYRYAVPLEMLAPLLIVFAIGMLPLKPSARALVTIFLLATVAFSVRAGDWGRREWLDRFDAAEIPELGDVSNTMLLMAGYEPYSHMVAQFPPEMPIVRIQSNFTSPDQNNPFNQVVRDRVGAHHGRFLMLIPDWEHKMAGTALRSFGLVADWKACQTVKDRLYDRAKYDLCPVTRRSE